MKNLFKLFCVNIIVLFSLLFVIEFICTLLEYRHIKIFKPDINFSNYIFSLKEYSKQCFSKFVYISKQEIRPAIIVKNSLKKPILLFGCSYTYGENLEKEDSFHYLLSKHTNRTVYNLGLRGGSLREFLYLLQNPELLQSLITQTETDFLLMSNQPKYFIYTYIPDHKRRLYTDLRTPAPHYLISLKNNSLTYTENFKIIYFFAAYRKFMDLKYRLDKYFARNKINNLLNIYLSQINNEIIKYPNTKFIILVYKNDKENWDRIKQQGIQIINIEDITHTDINSKQYLQKDGHPNEKAWQVIVPALAKELNL